MGFVKVIVIAMGVLIVIGFIVVAVTLVARMQDAAAPDEAYRTTVSLPRGAEVVETTITEDHILLRLSGDVEGDWLLVIDAGTGVERGRTRLLPGTP